MSSKNVHFETTRWSLLGQLDGPDADAALAALCEQYWQPLYAFVRQRTNDRHKAQDLTQAFFEHLISKQSLRHADRDRGRFRTFLLTTFKHFLSNQHARETTRKRGGGQQLLSLDFVDAESGYQRQRIDSASPEEQFERAWTLQLINRVVKLLREEYQANGQEDRFDILEPSLTLTQDDNTCSRFRQETGLSEAAARKAVSRLRQQFRALLKAEVSRLVHDKDHVDDEIRQMFRSLSR